MMETKKAGETRMLTPFKRDTKSELEFGTYIMPRAQGLRRMLSATTSDKSSDSLVDQPTRIMLVIRGMEESFTLCESGVLLLGRSDFRSGGFQPDLDLTPYGGHERGISRAHARLHMSDGAVYVTDLYSANGTFIGHQRLEPEKPHRLFDGDELVLGALSIRVRFE